MENNDTYGYEATKKAFDQKNMMEEREDFKEKYNMVFFEGDTPIKEKSILSEKKTSLKKKTLAAIAIVIGLTAGTIFTADVVNHPDIYMTTNSEYHQTMQEYKDKGIDNPRSISEIIHRTPNNFNIGGK